MGVIQELHRIMHRRDKNPEVLSPAPSSFVLIRKGGEQRLTIGQDFPLNPGPQSSEDDHDSMESLRVHVYANNHLGLLMLWQKGSLCNSLWGLDESKSEIKHTLTTGTLILKEENYYVKGSGIYFNAEATCLHGENWSLKYSPL